MPPQQIDATLHPAGDNNGYTEYFKTRLWGLKKSRGFRELRRGAASIGVQDQNDPLTELIAKKIIEIGQTRLKDPSEICVRAVEELGLLKG